MQEYMELHQEWPLVCKLVVLVAIVVVAAPAVAADFVKMKALTQPQRAQVDKMILLGTSKALDHDTLDEKGEWEGHKPPIPFPSTMSASG